MMVSRSLLGATNSIRSSVTLVNSSRLPIAGWALVDGRNCPAPSQANAHSEYSPMFPAPAANRADFNAGAWSTGTCTPHLSRPCRMGLMGRPGVMPTRWANWSLTPGRAESALVWAANKATPLRMSVWMILPLGVLAATLVTPRNSSGWWTTSMSAPTATAASATSWVQSKARRIVSAGPAGSPQMRPTLSQLSARWGG